MSEAKDIIRQAADAQCDGVGGYLHEHGLCLHVALDTLTTRLAEVERERAGILERWNTDAAASYDREESLREQLTQAREALRITHGVAQSMADSDSWIAEQAGMVRGDEVGEWVVPAAVEALATINEGETG